MTIQAHYWIQGLNMSLFAERLRLLRQARNITQARLAELLEVSPRVYNRWEKGGTLPDTDQQALIVMMDSLVKKSDVTRVIGKMAHD